MLNHSPPQPKSFLVKLWVVRGNVTEPYVASNEDLLIPVLVEGDEIADISVTDIGLLCQHSCHKDIVNTEYPLVTVLINL